MSSKKGFRTIFIIGEPHEFTNDLARKFDDNSPNNRIDRVVHGNWDDFYDLSFKSHIHMLMVDFSKLQSSEEVICETRKIIRVKSTEELAKIPIIGLFDNKETIKSHQFLQQSGINYFHIIGDDMNLFFANAYVIGFEDESQVYKVAHAVKLQVETKVTHNMYLAELLESEVKVETDLLLPEKLALRVDNFNGGDPFRVEMLEMYPSSEIACSLNSYKYEIAISDGWGGTTDDGTKVICAEDIDNWVSNIEEEDGFEKESLILVHFYTQKDKWPLNLMHNTPLTTLKFNSYLSFNPDIYANSEPHLIIFDITSEESMTEFDKLMTYFSESDERPFIIVKNHPSATEAIKKIYGYDGIMAFKGHFKREDFEKLLELLRNKNLVKDNRRLIKLEQNIYTASVDIKIRVTSITENEMTFMTDVEIPFFSILNLNNSTFNIFLTIVPSYYNLSPNMNGYHYMGILNGVTEKDRQNLRQVVRIFLRSHPKNWNKVDIDLNKLNFEEDEDEVVEVAKKEVEIKTGTSDIEIITDSPPEEEAQAKELSSSYKRQKSKGSKSKL